jgi:hypothetical protein
MTLLSAITEAGLLEDFKEICTPDISNPEALQWLRRRPQLVGKIADSYSETTIRVLRKNLGCPAALHGGKRKAPYCVTYRATERKRRAGTLLDLSGSGFSKTPRYAPTDDQFYQ